MKRHHLGKPPRLFKAATLAAGTLATLLNAHAQAQTVNLDMSSLPSAQGWSYSGSVPESSVYSVSEGELHQNTLGILTQPSDSVSYLYNVAPAPSSFDITLSARVTSEQGPWGALAVNVNGPYGQNALLFLGTSQFQADSPAGGTFGGASDNTLFHTYEMTGSFGPNGSYSLYRDGVYVGSTPLPFYPESSAQASVVLGDLGVRWEGTDVADISSFSATFTSSVPEPQWYGVLAGVGLLGFSARQVATRKQAASR